MTISTLSTLQSNNTFGQWISGHNQIVEELQNVVTLGDSSQENANGSIYINGDVKATGVLVADTISPIDTNVNLVTITQDTQVNGDIYLNSTGVGLLQFQRAGSITWEIETSADHSTLNINHVSGASLQIGSDGNITGTNVEINENIIPDAFSATITGTVSDISNHDTGDLAEGSNLYYTVARANTAFDNRLADKTTDNLTEGNNLYYTTQRWDDRLATKSTTNLLEGTNLYYTVARANTAFDNRLASKDTGDLTEGTNLYYTVARANTAFDNRLASKTTDNLSEGSTNEYFTQARARASISVDPGSSLTYNSGTGVIGYIERTEQEIRDIFGAGTGVSYNDQTGVFSIGQAVATGNSPTFTNMTLTGDISVGDDATITGNISAATVSGGMIASQADAETKTTTVNDHIMTPLRVHQAITARVDEIYAEPYWAGATTYSNVVNTYNSFPLGTRVAFWEERNYSTPANSNGGSVSISDRYMRIIRKTASGWVNAGG